MDELAERAQGLPPELFNYVFDLVFTTDPKDHHITYSWKPSHLLHVGRDSRAKVTPSFYGEGNVFIFASRRVMFTWLRLFDRPGNLHELRYREYECEEGYGLSSSVKISNAWLGFDCVGFCDDRRSGAGGHRGGEIIYQDCEGGWYCIWRRIANCRNDRSLPVGVKCSDSLCGYGHWKYNKDGRGLQ